MFIMFEDADNNFVYKKKKDADNYATTRVLATWDKFLNLFGNTNTRSKPHHFILKCYFFC